MKSLIEVKIVITRVDPDSHRKRLELEFLRDKWHDQRKMHPDEQGPQVPIGQRYQRHWPFSYELDQTTTPNSVSLKFRCPSFFSINYRVNSFGNSLVIPAISVSCIFYLLPAKYLSLPVAALEERDTILKPKSENTCLEVQL